MKHKHPRGLIILFLLPSITVLLLYRWLPVVWNFFLSFQKWKPLGANQWIGLKNYLLIVADPVFWEALQNTLVYFFVGTPIAIGLALLLALLVNEPIRGRNFYRTVIFLPYPITPVAIGLIWKWILNDRVGLLNHILRSLGIIETGVPFLQSFEFALPSVIGTTIWQVVGYFMILVLSGLQTIPVSLNDAALIDGAGPLRRTWSITLPLIKSTLFLCFIIGIINSFTVFDMVYVMTNGGPGHATEFLVTYIYRNAFEFNRLGYSAALTFVMFIVLLGVTFLSNRLSGGEAGGGAGYE
jgi:multiple sugar transport system permease protein